MAHPNLNKTSRYKTEQTKMETKNSISTSEYRSKNASARQNGKSNPLLYVVSTTTKRKEDRSIKNPTERFRSGNLTNAFFAIKEKHDTEREVVRLHRTATIIPSAIKHDNENAQTPIKESNSEQFNFFQAISQRFLLYERSKEFRRPYPCHSHAQSIKPAPQKPNQVKTLQTRAPKLKYVADIRRTTSLASRQRCKFSPIQGRQPFNDDDGTENK